MNTSTNSAEIEPQNANAYVDIEAVSTEVKRTVPDSEAIYSTFPLWTKRMIVLMVSLGSVLSPLSSSIYLPSLNTLSSALSVSTSRINLTVTVYLIFQALSPMFLGSLADTIGRRPVYIACFILYLAANIGLALQSTYPALLILRMLQSCGSSPMIALGNGVIADVFTSAERGKYIGFVTAGALLGPALGPAIGGALSTALNWRAVFWFLVAFGGGYMVIYVLIVPETGRSVVGNGEISPPPWNRPAVECMMPPNAKKRKEQGTAAERGQKTGLGVPNLLSSARIVIEKDCALVLLFGSVMITVFYCIMTVLPRSMKDIYGYNDLKIGLCYISLCGGATIGSILGGHALNYNYRRVAAQHGISVDKKRASDLTNFPIEKARLQTAFPSAILSSLCVIGFGWSLQARSHVAVPLVMLFLVGVSQMTANGTFSTLLVDLYPQQPTTASAAFNLTRCGVGAAGTAVVELIVRRMGLGWCFTFWGLLVIVLVPLMMIVINMGPEWRKERAERLKRNRERRENA